MPIQQQLVIWFLVVLAGITGIYSFTSGKMFPQQSAKSVVADQVTPYPTVSEVYVEPTSVPKEINIAGAAFVAKEQACVYTAKNLDLKLYSKGGTVRVDASTKGKDARQASIIITSTQAYIWDALRKEGIMLTEDPTGLFSPDGVLDLLSNQLGITPAELEETCKPQKVADTLFIAPKGISFTPMDESIGSLGSLLPSLGSLEGLIK